LQVHHDIAHCLGSMHVTSNSNLVACLRSFLRTIMFMQDIHISCLLSCAALPFALLLCVLLERPLECLRMASN